MGFWWNAAMSRSSGCPWRSRHSRNRSPSSAAGSSRQCSVTSCSVWRTPPINKLDSWVISGAGADDGRTTTTRIGGVWSPRRISGADPTTLIWVSEDRSLGSRLLVYPPVFEPGLRSYSNEDYWPWTIFESTRNGTYRNVVKLNEPILNRSTGHQTGQTRRLDRRSIWSEWS